MRCILKTALILSLLPLTHAVLAAETGGYATATGGGDAKPVYADSLWSLERALFWPGRKVIIYTGNDDEAIRKAEADPCSQWSKTPREVTLGSNVTLIGAPGSSANFGLRVSGNSNVIIQDMTIAMLQGGARNGDAIGIERGARNVWIHHNNLYNKRIQCPDTPDNDTTFDGLIDIRDGADNITVSYNLIHDHPKVGLDGASDHDVSQRRITYHHNIYTTVHARLPLQRFGFTHEYNNIYRDVDVSGINVRDGGQALVEANWFEDVLNPVTSRDSPDVGYWDLRNNNIQSPADFDKYHITWNASPSVKKNADDWVTTKPFPPEKLTYTYTADPVACVHEHLAEVAGPGKDDRTLGCEPAAR